MLNEKSHLFDVADDSCYRYAYFGEKVVFLIHTVTVWFFVFFVSIFFVFYGQLVKFEILICRSQTLPRYKIDCVSLG